jgi:DNA-binding transcriptional MerR regulator
MDRESKPFYKIGEVCELTGTQPYVLRFWESEFPTLAPEKNRSGQRIYRKRDIDLIERIKTLLYEKEYTIAGARKVLESEEAETDEEGFDGRAHDAEARSDGASGRRDPAAGTGGAAERASSGGAASGALSSKDPRRAARDEPRPPELPFRTSHSADAQLETEVKNLRAKLARAEAELKAILADMDRHDQM